MGDAIAIVQAKQMEMIALQNKVESLANDNKALHSKINMLLLLLQDQQLAGSTATSFVLTLFLFYFYFYFNSHNGWLLLLHFAGPVSDP